jgi:hypothetical protein
MKIDRFVKSQKDSHSRESKEQESRPRKVGEAKHNPPIDCLETRHGIMVKIRLNPNNAPERRSPWKEENF